MPIYDYKCEKCENIQEEFRPISEYKCNSLCEKCGALAKRIITGGVIKSGEGSPRWSKAFGINPQQIPKMKKKHPDDVYRSDGAMLVKNPKHEKELCKRFGMDRY
jgi:putative FmdB family regulatory protein